MPLVFNQEAINGILFTLHFQKELPIVAHQKLMQMTGKEVMDVKQVTEFFEKIDNEEFGLKKMEEITLAQVLNVPDFGARYLDIDTRLRLRKTCTTIREIINQKPLHIDCLHYECEGENIEISTNEGFKVTYKINEEGLKVTSRDRVKSINAESEEKKIKLIQQDLMSILCSEKLRINTLRIESDQMSLGPRIGMKALRNTLNQIPNKLKINNLEYFVLESRDVVLKAALKKIDPEHLRFLQRKNESFYWASILNIYTAASIKEWKRLKSLKISCPKLLIPDIINSYTHFEYAHLEICRFYGRSDIMLSKYIIVLIDKLLQNPNLKQLKICAENEMGAVEFQDINGILQQYNNNAPYSCWISIPYPDSDKKLEMLVEKNMIWFKGPCYVKGELEEERSDEEDDMPPI
ncbi:hypothetical protein CRE_22966 [Caenorhabditis remanei]|uniref:DUF38 domain-containing protein n=1 Tax=Caenorhabditis remanei TaxID=31234 RepID=E3MW33_CAERE|nr:hypothetical protein CRE_22966 [Caenorhabditis remanei]